jgi:putative PIN family toxin of toxin-antitoxin system
MMRIVLDTDVIIAAARSENGASRRLLIAALQRQVILLASIPLIIEYEAVLTRPEHLAAAHLSSEDAILLLDSIVSVAEPVRLAFLWRPALKDPDDDMVLEAAVNGRADRIATFNRKDFADIGGRFGIIVSSPGDALKALENKP